MKPRFELWIPLVACAIPAFGADTVAVAPANIADLKTLDEVVVTGNLDSLSEAKNAVAAAEDKFYARYNELNKDDRYDIACHLETPRDHHSRFTTRVCEAGYVEEGAHDAAMGLYASNSNDRVGVLNSGSAVRMRGSPEQLRKRTLELIRKDPELLRALLERTRLQEHYDALRKQKFGGRRFVWD